MNQIESNIWRGFCPVPIWSEWVKLTFNQTFLQCVYRLWLRFSGAWLNIFAWGIIILPMVKLCYWSIKGRNLSGHFNMINSSCYCFHSHNLEGRWALFHEKLWLILSLIWQAIILLKLKLRSILTLYETDPMCYL